MNVCSESGETFEAETYIATNIDQNLHPFDWYKEHVLRGAKAGDLPADYITMIDAVVSEVDPDAERKARELAVYSKRKLR